ncbi:MAG: hypothetical protein ABI954_04590 [Pyrinomonadaceae bacterium]
MNIKLGILICTILLAAAFAGCQNTQTAATTSAAPAANTPTEAYKNLYAAVKSQKTENIKQNMSTTTQQFAEAMSQMQKKTVEEMYKNGLIESTMSPNLPSMRDERVKDNFGALEVQNPNGTWQDVPFVKEDGNWKLAVGDLFKNTYVSPGKPAAQANANTQTPQMLPVPSSNANTMSNVKVMPLPNVKPDPNAQKPGLEKKKFAKE